MWFVSALALGGWFAVDATGASTPSLSAQQAVSAQPAVSQNWSGYVVQNPSGQSFSSVSGSWTQPAASSSTGGYSAFWVGIGGQGQSQSLEQVGTGADVVNGQTRYYAWYELLPGPQEKLSLAVNPGDQMAGKVTVDGNAVTVSLANQSTGQSVNQTLQMSNPDTSSAEWIAEAPAGQMADGSYQVLPLADFGKVNFTGASATAGGHSGSIADPNFSVQKVDLAPTAGHRFIGVTGDVGSGGAGVAPQGGGGASTGDVSSDGSAFTVTYSGQGSGQTAVSPVGGDPGSGSAGSGGYGDSGYGPGGYGYGGYGSGGYDPYADPGYGNSLNR